LPHARAIAELKGGALVEQSGRDRQALTVEGARRPTFAVKENEKKTSELVEAISEPSKVERS
jgi:hypothetical protein